MYNSKSGRVIAKLVRLAIYLYCVFLENSSKQMDDHRHINSSQEELFYHMTSSEARRTSSSGALPLAVFKARWPHPFLGLFEGEIANLETGIEIS